MLQDSLNKAFGLKWEIEEIRLKGLPLYMTSGRKFYRTYLGNIAFLIIKISDKEKFGVVALKKQLSQYCDKSDLNVAFYFENLSRIQRDALIKKEIPFISLPDQIYLPFLGVLLSNRFKSKKIVSGSKMMPATQCLFLYMLYNCEKEYFIKSQAAEELGFTRTSITRASEQLKQMGIISEESNGKEIRMHTSKKGRELYEMAKPYLINPVQKVISVDLSDVNEFYVAGESALSNNTMLGHPKEDTFAVYKGHPLIGKIKEIDPRWQEGANVCRLELWKYDPALFQKNGEVDIVSIAMSLVDNSDERVQGELNTYLEEYKW